MPGKPWQKWIMSGILWLLFDPQIRKWRWKWRWLLGKSKSISQVSSCVKRLHHSTSAFLDLPKLNEKILISSSWWKIFDPQQLKSRTWCSTSNWNVSINFDCRINFTKNFNPRPHAIELWPKLASNCQSKATKIFSDTSKLNFCGRVWVAFN